MAAPITSGLLAAKLNKEIINEAFEIARSNRTGILSTVRFGSATVPFEGYKISWLDMQMNAAGGVVKTAADNAATEIVLTDGTGGSFRAGMTFSVTNSEEVILITAVAGDTLTVKRGFGGTTAAAIIAKAAITIDNVGRPENSGAENDSIYQPYSVQNFFQTMDTAVEFSRRALATAQFGSTNDLKFQLSERIKQLTIQMDRTLVRGRKDTAQIGGKEVTYTGGIRYFLDQAGAIKKDAAAADLNLDMLNDINEEVVRRGGMTNTIAVGLKMARKLSALVSANYSSERLANWTADEGSVMKLPSDMPLIGTVNTIVVDTNLDDNEVIIYDASKISIIPMASGNGDEDGNWTTKDATQPGQDGERVRIIGDFAMEIRQANTHMARLYNIGAAMAKAKK